MQNQIEIKILVTESNRETLEEIIKVLLPFDVIITNKGGGNLPGYSGYHVTLRKP